MSKQCECKCECSCGCGGWSAALIGFAVAYWIGFWPALALFIIGGIIYVVWIVKTS